MNSSPPSVPGIVLSVSALIQGQVFMFGQSLPYESEADVPEFLKPYIVRPNAKPVSQKRQLNYRLNRPYSVDADGFRLASVEQQAAEMEAMTQERELVEEQLSGPPDEVLAAALAVVQDSHDQAVQRDLAEAQIKARYRDAADVAAQEFINEQANNSSDEIVSPTVQPIEHEEMPTPKPRKQRKRYVNRNGVWLRAMKIACRVGEPIYVRESKGKFAKIGIVADDGSLPSAPVREYLERKENYDV